MAKRKQGYGFGRRLHEPMLRGDLSAWLGWWPERLSVAEVLGAWRSALARRGSPGSPATVQLYVHFPFCQSSCAFCQYFHAVPREQHQFDDYAAYLSAVMRTYRDTLGRVRVSNAYFGGGTPSALPARQLARVVEAFERAFHVSGEFTCEAHPGNLDEDKLDLLRRVGVNRLSMGLQSFDATVLKRIGRINPACERVRQLVQRARRLGMWVNTDLVLGLPGQTPESFRFDLEHVLAEVRPDCLTIYRYQPVPGLPDPPAETMRYSRVLRPRLLAHALRLGYLPATSGGDDRWGKDFFRNSLRTWAQWAARCRYEAMRLARTDAELPTYALFENNESHVLGLGPGALSHVYGHSWYRDVTALATLSPTTEPVYVGTRLSAEDECRSALLGAFAAGKWIDAHALGRRSGVDVDVVFGSHLRQAMNDGTVRRVGGWYVCARGVRMETHPSLFGGLLPTTPLEDTAACERRTAEIAALRGDRNVQTDLVAAGDHLSQEQPWGSGASTGPGAVLKAWAALVGLSGPGERFADAVVDRIEGDEAHFRLLPAPAPVLRIIVTRECGQPAFVKAGPYAISYVPRAGAPLAPVESNFLRALGACTANALGILPAPTVSSVHGGRPREASADAVQSASGSLERR